MPKAFPGARAIDGRPYGTQDAEEQLYQYHADGVDEPEGWHGS